MDLQFERSVKAVNQLPQFLRIRELAFCLIFQALAWNALQGAWWITYSYLWTSETRHLASFKFVSVVCTIYRFAFKCTVAVFSILFTMRCIVFEINRTLCEWHSVLTLFRERLRYVQKKNETRIEISISTFSSTPPFHTTPADLEPFFTPGWRAEEVMLQSCMHCWHSRY